MNKVICVMMLVLLTGCGVEEDGVVVHSVRMLKMRDTRTGHEFMRHLDGMSHVESECGKCKQIKSTKNNAK